MSSRDETGRDPLVIPKRWRGPYARARCSAPPPALLLEGVEQFNRGEYFEQHETLEELWRQEPDDVRYLYQGILLVGVGFHHLGRGNYVGAVSKLRGGLEKLRWFTPRCQGVDVKSLVRDAEGCLARLLELGAERMGEFEAGRLPRVRLVGET